MRVVKKIDDFFQSFSLGLLVICLSAMILFSFLTIILRWGQVTYLWLDPLVRHLVFLSAFLGGSLATGKKNHIAIDVIPRFLEMKNQLELKRWIERLIALTSFLTLVWLSKASYDLALVEREFTKEAFLGLSQFQVMLIMPLGFGLIAIRFFLGFLLTFNPVSSTHS